MKKIIIILVSLIIFIVALVFVFTLNKDKKFLLEDIHYNTEERFIKIDSKELNKLMNDKKSFVVFTYLPYCTFSVPCDVIFETFLNRNNMSFYEIPYDEFTEVKKFKDIKYAPSVVIVKDGKVVTYLDANSDDDIEKYQNADTFGDWITKYIKLK